MPLPPDVHRRLDLEIPSLYHVADIQELENAAELLKILLTRCRDAYSTTWPVNIDAVSQTLLKSREDIYQLLQNCQKKRDYAEIRELPEFHVQDLSTDGAITDGAITDEKIIQRVNIEINEPLINKYFNEKPQLPMFQAPPDASDQVRKHINDLGMPLNLDDDRLPSLLLHNLQYRSSDAHSERLKKLFDVRDT